MNWSDVLADPSLQDLPYKIELNGYGQIVMTPASNRHGRLQTEIAYLLQTMQDGGISQVECSVDTSSGVKVADVAWYSDSFSAKHGASTPFQEAPELCVEVVSPSNTSKELQEKIQLYFSAGAQEVWVCREDGQLEFYAPSGRVERSGLFPEFPVQVS